MILLDPYTEDQMQLIRFTFNQNFADLEVKIQHWNPRPCPDAFHPAEPDYLPLTSWQRRMAKLHVIDAG